MTARPDNSAPDPQGTIAELQRKLDETSSELGEAFVQQMATAEVLQVINSSPADLGPVFDAILEKAMRPCQAQIAVFWTYDGEFMCASAIRGAPQAYVEFLQRGPHRPSHVQLRLLGGTEGFVQIADLTRSEGYRIGDPLPRAAADLGGIRTLLVVPLRKSGTVLGTFGIYRQEVKPFSDRQIALVQSFANQAVIAIENARLFDEVRDRQADLARSVDELTATGDVLKIISRSSVDLETVLDTLVDTVARLCRADQATMFRRRDDKYHLVAARGFSAVGEEFVLTHPLTDDRGTLSGRVAAERRPVHIPDVVQDPEYTYREAQTIL